MPETSAAVLCERKINSHELTEIESLYVLFCVVREYHASGALALFEHKHLDQKTMIEKDPIYKEQDNHILVNKDIKSFGEESSIRKVLQ